MNFKESTREIRRNEIEHGRPSEAVVEAIADVEGTKPTSIPPLYESIDPDHLDALHQQLDDVEVRFIHAGYLVDVEDAGAIVVGTRA